jgi:hypothetical protein
MEIFHTTRSPLKFPHDNNGRGLPPGNLFPLLLCAQSRLLPEIFLCERTIWVAADKRINVSR